MSRPSWRDDPKTGRGAAGFLNERGIKPDDKVGLTRAMIEYDRSNRKSDVVTRPTRDLNDDRVWSGGSRDFDERTGTNRPGHRSERRYEYQPTEKETERRGMRTSATRSLRDELMADMGNWR